MLVDREKILMLTTGSKAMDAMLGGEIQIQSITEVYGEFRRQKSFLLRSHPNQEIEFQPDD